MRPYIALAVPGMPILPQPLSEQSLGGSETAGFEMARAMAGRGWDVALFCNTPEQAFVDGVSLTPFDGFRRSAVEIPTDVIVGQRVPALFGERFNSKLNLLWCHDLALRRQRDEIHTRLWNIDKVMVLSRFHAEQYQEVYGLEADDLYLTRNGIDLDAIRSVSAKGRRRKAIIYTSRPERGVDNLLEAIFPRLLERHPDLELQLAGYDNRAEHLLPFYQKVEALKARFGDRVKDLGSLPKRDLYKAYKKASALVYPTPSPWQKDFREISCITAMEAMACGLPMVTSKNGALPETLHPDSGLLIQGDPWTESYRDRFVAGVERLLSDEVYWQRCSKRGIEEAERLSWDGVAEQWDRDFRQMIEDRNDPVRLAYHFYRHSEIEGIRKLQEKHEIPKPLLDRIDRHYPWFTSDQAVIDHYVETVGPYQDEFWRQRPIEDYESMFHQRGEQRFHWFETQLRKNGSERVLDYGCGHGWCDVYMHNRTGVEFLGVDADPMALEWQDRFKEKFARDPSKITSLHATHTTLDPTDWIKEHGEIDTVLIMEVLEHVWDPIDVAEKVTRWARDDALVCLTVPYGPWETEVYFQNPFRGHIREWSVFDLRDVFGAQKDFNVTMIYAKHCPVNGSPLGWLCVTYRKSDTPLGRIDWERKLRWQRPRESVTAFMMAGGEKACETLHWSLRSIREVVDEIVVADTGLDQETGHILSQYDLTVIPSRNPLEAGFEVPRNHGLEAVKTDWGLWIDTDERLVNPAGVNKYLRDNRYNAYGVRQHHFACDTGFPADMPTRLIRSVARDGRRPRFHGLIHEHPELALNEGMGNVIVLQDVHIAHVGYLNEGIRRERFGRNLPLLQADERKYPDRLLQKYLIMRDLVQLSRYHLEVNGGVLTPEIRQNLEQVKDLYRKHFLGKRFEMNLDPLQYYSEALRYLGEGFDVSFDLRVNRDGLGDQLNGGAMVRFADAEEAKREIAHRLAGKFAPLEGEYW